MDFSSYLKRFRLKALLLLFLRLMSRTFWQEMRLLKEIIGEAEEQGLSNDRARAYVVKEFRKRWAKPLKLPDSILNLLLEAGLVADKIRKSYE